MKELLVDTHALLWMVLDDRRLPRRARVHIEQTGRLVYSTVSFWEIALKISRGGFDFELPRQWHRELAEELRKIGAERLPIESDHCRALQDLPWHHKDPFDRMLIAQAVVESLPVVTGDPRFTTYGVKVLW